MFTALYDSDVFKEFDGKVAFVMQNTPQPWHPQGTYAMPGHLQPAPAAS